MASHVEVDLRAFLEVERKLQGAVAAGVEVAAEQILDLAKQLAPRESGDLAASGKVEGASGDLSRTISFGDGLPDERAAAQEFGTAYQPAQPYLGPAAKEIDVSKEVAAAIKAALGL